MKGDWCMSEQEITVWVDTSSLAIGMVVESNGVAAEDAPWLRSVHEDKHINLAELDAVLRGINLALQLYINNVNISQPTETLVLFTHKKRKC